MEKILYRILMPVIMVTFCYSAFAQVKNEKAVYPEIDKPMPNFVFNHLTNYPKKQVSLKDFKGQWLILNMWTKHCHSCIEGFSEDNRMQKELGTRAQLLMVGEQDKENDVQHIFARQRQKLNLNNLSCAFDATIFQRFHVISTPYIIIIDPNGIVRGLTDNISLSVVNDFLAGKHPVLPKVYRANQVRDDLQFDPTKPFLTNGNGGADTDFLYRSLLSKWSPSLYITGGPATIKNDSADEKIEHSLGRFQVCRESLRRLYGIAYRNWDAGFSMENPLYGKSYPDLVLEIRDHSLFNDADSNVVTGKNFYCYSLTVPPAKGTAAFMMEVMQRDLKNYFGYDVSVEIRKMPYLKLVASDEVRSRLKTKGGKSSVVYSSVLNGDQKNYTVTCTNISISEMMLLWWRNYAPYGMPCILDETGIEGNIDITVKLGEDDNDNRISGLKENGLEVVKGEKEMQVIVIKDPKPTI